MCEVQSSQNIGWPANQNQNHLKMSVNKEKGNILEAIYQSPVSLLSRDTPVSFVCSRGPSL